MRLKRTIRVAVSILLVFTFLYLAFRNVNLSESMTTIRNSNLIYLSVSLIFVITAFILRGLRWKILTKIIGYDLSIIDAVKMHGSAIFLNLFMPGRAGEIYKLAISKKRGVSRSKALSAIYVERLIDIFIIFCILIVSTFFIDFNSPQILQIILSSFILIMTLIILAVFAVKNESFGMRIVNMLLSFGSLKKHRNDAKRIFSDIVLGFRSFGIRNLISTVIVTTTLWISDIVVFALLVGSVGFFMPFSMYAFVLSSAVLLMVIPVTPSGFGLVELYMQNVLSRMSTPEISGAAVIVYRSFNLLSVFVISAIAFLLDAKD